jgi:hypothetical protein
MWKPGERSGGGGGRGSGSGAGAGSSVSGTSSEGGSNDVFTITGTNWVGETLTANTSALGDTGAISYQWERGGIPILGETDSTYVPVIMDQGEVTSAGVTIATISVSVDVDPEESKTLQFSAIVSNSSNQSVVWTVSSTLSSIDASGLLSVDMNEINGTELVVTATSVVDGSKIGSAKVSIIDGRGRAGKAGLTEV